MKKFIKKIAYLFGFMILGIVIAIGSGVRFDIPAEKLRSKYANENSKFIMLDGMMVHYRDEGAGFPLLLLHGAPSSLHTFDRLAADLSRQYRVIRLDLPGFGLTGPNAGGDYSLQWYLQFLESFLNELHVDACYAAGNSLGGRLAAELAHAGRVTKLVLISASGYPMSEEGLPAVKMARIPLLRPIVRNVTPRFFIAMNLRQAYGADQHIPEETVDRYYELLLRAGNRDTFIAMSNRTPEDISDHIKTLKIPTLILWGGADSIIPPSYADRFNRDIPGSSLIVYPGIGHLPQEVIPERIAADMRAFLQ